MRHFRTIAALVVMAALGGFVLWALLAPGPPSPDGRAVSDRYREIADMIDDNLHFSVHLTWAVTTDTIASVRGEIDATDIPVLVEMLADDRAAIRIGASSLLATLGEAALPALAEAARSPDWKTSMAANDALILIEMCRTNPAGTDPVACPDR